MPRTWFERVRDVLEAIERIEQYTQDMTETDFEADTKTRDATHYNLLIIGEASSYLPEEVTDNYPDIPWIEVRGMRNVVAHGYFAIKLPIIWKTVSDDLGPLKSTMEEILRNHSG